jgi:threonine dehydrogenase-like Zn-dependent dehydrogenase
MPRIAQLIAPGKIKIKEHPSLQAGPGEAIVQVGHAGICGTDLALFQGDYPVPLPHVCGHEFTGTVKQVGEGVDSEWVGKTVTAEINNTCLAFNRISLCPACRKGLPSHCLERTVTGIIKHNGAFADEVAVAAGALHKIPDNVDPLTATLTEPLAAALQTFVMSPPVQGDTIVVLGPGRLGILIVFVAALKGLKVLAVSRSPAKRERTLSYGAQWACSPDEAEQMIKENTEGLGANFVVDTTGNPDGITQALKLVQPCGTVCCKTTCGLPASGLDMTKLVVDEVRLQGSRCGPYEPALEILKTHHEKLKNLISSTRPLEETQAGLESASSENKVVLNIERL